MTRRITVILLKLYIANHSRASAKRLEELKTLFDRSLGSGYSLSVVDVLQDPAGAMDDGVIATPTLVKLEPGPPVRVIGDLTDWEQIRQTLQIN
jgi:circadian clock protein KaiB